MTAALDPEIVGAFTEPEELLARFPGYELAGPPGVSRSTLVCGAPRMPVSGRNPGS